MTNISLETRALLRIGLATAACLLAVLFAVLNGRWLLAQGYSHYASEYAFVNRGGDDVLMAADLAVRLSPYSARPHLVRASVLEAQRRYEEARAELKTAIARAPTNPFVWQGYVRFKYRRTEIDEDLVAALIEVERLAPASFWLDSENARFGLKLWEWGGAQHRELWGRSIRRALLTNRRGLLRTALRHRRAELLCREFGATEPGIAAWCLRAAQAREACFGQHRRFQAWCRHQGLNRDPLVE